MGPLAGRELDTAWEQAQQAQQAQQARGFSTLLEVGPGEALSFTTYENLSRAYAYCLPWLKHLGVENIERCQPHNQMFVRPTSKS